MSQAGMLAFPFGEYRDTEQVLLAQCQREVYAKSERIEQFTDRTGSGYERLLYVHEDLQGNTRYYTKDNGQSFAELTYDAWGMPESPNKLLNNDHGNYVYATCTGHIFDTTLDIYFAEARFYDAQTRQWLAMDPIKDGGNWYQYCYSNPLTYWDPTGLAGFSLFECGSEWLDNFLNDMIIRENASADYRDSFQMGQSDAIIGILSVSAGNTVSEIEMVLSFLFGDTEKVDMYMAAISTNEIDYEALSGRASNKEAYYQGVKSGSNSMYLIGLAVSAFGSYAAATGGTGFAAGAGASVTGAGALVGVPAMTVSAGVIALGSGVAVSGANISMTSQNSLNQAREKLNELADQGDNKTSLDYKDKITEKNGNYYTDKETLDEIGRIESEGVDFSELDKQLQSSRPSSEGGTSNVYKYSDPEGTRFIIHEVTDSLGNIIHRDFDAVRIPSGQLILKE